MLLNILLVVHLLVTAALIGIVLIQKSEGGALGIGGGGGGAGGFMTGRETANLLTRTTGILATLFMIMSLAIAYLSNQSHEKSSVLDSLPVQSQSLSQPSSAKVPVKPTQPSAPVAQ